ncbi:hypothetical protein IKF03_03715 [Candidatus Saccharibacteria bacterium]|nr:hypothetical protein [Candidatus Saccharibacteria bacterium]
MSEEKAKKTEEKSEKKTTKKGKGGLIAGIICGVVAVIVAVVLIIVLGGGYKKKTETFTIKNEKRGSEVTFDFAAEELGYEAKDSTDGIKFTNPEDKSTITLRLYDTNKRDIIKPADAFYSDKYHDWSEIKVGDYEGFKIFRSADLAGKVEMGLVLDMYDEEKSRVDGLTIIIEQSSMQPREAEFNPIEFYESEDFQHLLKTIKLKVEASEEE